MVEELVETVTELTPEILSSIVSLARLARAGASQAEIVSEAERLAVRVAYRKMYGG